MALGLQKLTLNTAHLESMGKLFAALGFELKEGRVDKGSPFLRGSLGAIELTLMSVSKKIDSGAPGIGMRIYVKNIEEVVGRLRELEKVQIIMDVEYLNEGKTALALDADGRSIEICS